MSRVLSPPFSTVPAPAPNTDDVDGVPIPTPEDMAARMRRFAELLANSRRDPTLPQGGMTPEEIQEKIDWFRDMISGKRQVRNLNQPPELDGRSLGPPVYVQMPPPLTEFIPGSRAPTKVGEAITGAAEAAIRHTFPAVPEPLVNPARRDALMKVGRLFTRPIGAITPPTLLSPTPSIPISPPSGLSAPINRRTAIKLGTGGALAASQADKLKGLVKPVTVAPVQALSPAPPLSTPPLVLPKIPNVIEVMEKNKNGIYKVIKSMPRHTELPLGYTYNADKNPSLYNVVHQILDKNNKVVWEENVSPSRNLKKEDIIDNFLHNTSRSPVMRKLGKELEFTSPGKRIYINSEYSGYMSDEQIAASGSAYAKPYFEIKALVEPVERQINVIDDKLWDTLDKHNSTVPATEHKGFMDLYKRRDTGGYDMGVPSDLAKQLDLADDIVKVSSLRKQIFPLQDARWRILSRFSLKLERPIYTVRYYPDSVPDIRHHPEWKMLKSYPRSQSYSNRSRIIGQFSSREEANQELMSWLKENFGIEGDKLPKKGQKIRLPNGDSMTIRLERNLE